MLHLVQNFLYLGGELFFRELAMTISNRITGLPTKDELKAFYQAHGLVHHGAESLNVVGFLYHLWLGVTFPGWTSVVVTAVVGAVWVVGRKAGWRKDCRSMAITRYPEVLALGRRFVALWGWVVGTILLPMIMLPAFTQEYGIHGTGLHWYFLGIGATASVLYGVRAAVDAMPRELGSTLSRNFLNVLLGLVVLGLLGNVVWQAVTCGDVFMTNINPVTVGFFAGEAGHGVCELASLPEAGDIDPSQCHVSYMRQQEYYTSVRPRYFFFFRELFPGFAECLPSALMPMQHRGGDDCVRQMEDRLSARFEKAYENGLFQVFDLAAPTRG